MVRSSFNYTERLRRIMKCAENEATCSKHKILLPGHLLLACLHERTGAFGELWLRCNFNRDAIKARIEVKERQFDEVIKTSQFFQVAVIADVEKAMIGSIELMKRYNQIYLNEGHMLKSLITSNLLNQYLSEEDRSTILNVATTARDMITHLGHYQFPQLNSRQIRRVRHEDKKELITFVETYFSKEWSDTIATAFSSQEPSVYVAVDSAQELIGFAAFDVYMNRKGYFGPMGVKQTKRAKGIGYSLLHHCLREMHEIGYEYAIIGGAGPMEFYEKACHAAVIPLDCYK